MMPLEEPPSSYFIYLFIFSNIINPCVGLKIKPSPLSPYEMMSLSSNSPTLLFSYSGKYFTHLLSIFPSSWLFFIFLLFPFLNPVTSTASMLWRGRGVSFPIHTLAVLQDCVHRGAAVVVGEGKSIISCLGQCRWSSQSR
jgi:hypothetical protein